MAATTSSKHTCLFRIAYNKPGEHECILLDKGDSVTLGRADSCDVVLTESCAVSRRHCVLDRTAAGEWTVTDLKSGNGVHVNGCRIPASTPQVLQDRDLLEIGRQAATATYKFQFYKHAKILVRDQNANVTRKKLPLKRPASFASPSSLIRDKIRQREKWLKHEMELKLAEKETEFTGLISEVQDMKHRLEEELAEQRRKEELLAAQEREYKARVETIENQHREKETELHALLLEQSSDRRTLEERLQQLQNEQQTLQDDLDQERRKHEEDREILQDQLTFQFMCREETFRKYIEEKEKDLKSEKTKLEQELQLQIQEKEQLSSSVKSLRSKQSEYWAAIQAAETKAQSLATAEETTKTRMLSSFEDLVESELMCAICSELFVQATSLGCSHSFCQLCIDKWMDKKKECPNCRQKIKSHVRSIVLDNYIDRLMDMLSEDTRAHRLSVISDRKAEQEAWDKQKAEEKAKKQQAKANQEMQRAANQHPHNVAAHRGQPRIVAQFDAIARQLQEHGMRGHRHQGHRMQAANPGMANNHHGYRHPQHQPIERLQQHAQAYNQLNARYMEEYRNSQHAQYRDVNPYLNYYGQHH